MMVPESWRQLIVRAAQIEQEPGALLEVLVVASPKTAPSRHNAVTPSPTSGSGSKETTPAPWNQLHKSCMSSSAAEWPLLQLAPQCSSESGCEACRSYGGPPGRLHIHQFPCYLTSNWVYNVGHWQNITTLNLTLHQPIFASTSHATFRPNVSNNGMLLHSRGPRVTRKEWQGK